MEYWSLILCLASAIPSRVEQTTFLEANQPFVTKQSTSSDPKVQENSRTTTIVSLFPSTTSPPENYIHSEHRSSMESSKSTISDSSSNAPLVLQDLIIFDIEEPVITMQSFCQQTCSDEKKRESKNGCCLSCDCSDRCLAAGTCCLDKMNGSQHFHNPAQFLTLTQDICVNTFISGIDYNYQSVYNSSYLLFQHCNKNIDFQTREKCLHPNTSELEEMIPVFSLKTSQHHRNVFCSKCMSDSQSIVPWQTKLTCNISNAFPKVSHVENFSISDFLSTNPKCALMWDPPINTAKAESCLHEDNIVSDCNDPTLDTMCKQYYSPVIGNGIIYRNVFCMECANPLNRTSIKEKCNKLQISFKTTSFSSLLSLSKNKGKHSNKDISKINICDFPMKYNEKLDTCIRYSCAVTELNVADVCTPVFSHLKGINLEYRLRVMYPIDSTDIGKSLQSLLFNRNIMTVIGFNKSSDAFCHATLQDMQVSSNILEIRVLYIKTVNTANFEQSFKEYVTNIETYNEMVKGNKNAFILKMEKSSFEPILEHSATFVSFTKSMQIHGCFFNAAMSKIQFCEAIMFLEYQFKIHVNGNLIIDEIMFVPGEYVLRQALNGTITYVQICLDDFVSAYKAEKEKKKLASAAQTHMKYKGIFLFLLYAVNLPFIHM